MPVPGPHKKMLKGKEASISLSLGNGGSCPTFMIHPLLCPLSWERFSNSAQCLQLDARPSESVLVGSGPLRWPEGRLALDRSHALEYLAAKAWEVLYASEFSNIETILGAG